jgi:iron complex outermembrane receptor protein
MGNFQRRLLGGAAALSLMAAYGAAQAQDRTFNIAPQPLASALNQFGAQSDTAVLVRPDLANAKMTKGVTGAVNAELALNTLLEGTGLSYRREGDTFLIVKADADPQSGSAAGDGAEGTVEALIVTAQKREENIQDVPIAISAFTSKDLEEQKIEGGFDLLKAIPNVTFSKNNFTSYNFSIRGIGTKAVSATTDPGVAVSFNNIALLQNRLFEQEYFDVARVEVLRGPQGTLYGRNATAGVINVISAQPDLNDFSGWVKGEVGNHHAKRASAMLNVPILADKLGVRFAGAYTDRAGYDFNTGTGNAVNGRDLWSARLTLGFEPTENIRANLIWERFNEDDNRSRTGKQLCHHDSGPTEIGGVPITASRPEGVLLRQAMLSQGCKMGSLYDDGAFGTPNGLSLPFVLGLHIVGTVYPPDDLGSPQRTLLDIRDPYSVQTTDAAACAPNPAPCYVPGRQSTDLRVIDSFRDPVYRAKADIFELNLDWDVSDALTLSSQTAYNRDSTYSFQDYNRFNTVPIFTDTSTFESFGPNRGFFKPLAPGGIFCDPQLGCSNSLAGFDIAQAKGEQFTSEIRLQSDFEGPINFSAGANYTRFRTLVDYYVFFNLMTAAAMVPPFNWNNSTDPDDVINIYECYFSRYSFMTAKLPAGDPAAACPYIDPNPIESINGEGHNYFRSKNPYKLKSWAAFGELYWNLSEKLKLTAGLRYTDDQKTFIPVPSQILMAPGLFAGGDISRGYPELPPIKQHWGEWTGRLGLDWKPDLSFTDQTLLYAFYSHGYKAGGANPPTPGFGHMSYMDAIREMCQCDIDNFLIPRFDERQLFLTAVDYEPTFEPEFVDAFEVGAKNTLLDGAAQLNTTAFFYDYKDYQVSQIKDRTAVNENFDAQAWGVEFETLFSPSRDFQIIANLGYLDTRIADGESSIDIMNRTQGNPDLVLARPWLQKPSNCVVPIHVVQAWLTSDPGTQIWRQPGFCGGTNNIIDAQAYVTGGNLIDPATGQDYDPLYYNGENGTININGGAGIRAQLGGNELPNAPHWTMNIGAQYGRDFLSEWRMTVRGDAYWQSQSWARVYNDNPYDKLHGWYNVNLSVWFEKPDDELKIEFYVKNLLDKTPITDAFLNSDDTALTTNVFVLDPRLIGLSIRKGF